MTVPRKPRLLLLVGALAFLTGAVLLAVAAPRLGVPDGVSAAVSSGYVVLMLLFLLANERAGGRGSG